MTFAWGFLAGLVFANVLVWIAWRLLKRRNDKLERAIVERTALEWGLRALPDESTAALRQRIVHRMTGVLND